MIHVWLGLNIERFSFFEAEKNKEFVFNGESSYVTTPGKKLYFPEATIHPTKIPDVIDRFIGEHNYIDEFHILTHSHSVINHLSDLIRSKQVSENQIKIHILNEDNSNIDIETGYDGEGYLLPTWPAGFLHL